MKFIRQLLGKEDTPDPIDEEMKLEIEGITNDEIKEYEEAFNEEYEKDLQEKEEEDEEAKNAQLREGANELGKKITDKAWIVIEPKVEQKLRAKTDNEVTIQAGKKGAKKTCSMIVSKTIEIALKRITKSKEEKTEETT